LNEGSVENLLTLKSKSEDKTVRITNRSLMFNEK